MNVAGDHAAAALAFERAARHCSGRPQDPSDPSRRALPGGGRMTASLFAACLSNLQPAPSRSRRTNTQRWTRDFFHALGLHRLRGTVRYPEGFVTSRRKTSSVSRVRETRTHGSNGSLANARPSTGEGWIYQCRRP